MQTLGPKFQLRRIEAWRLAKRPLDCTLGVCTEISMNTPAWDAPKKLVKLDGSWAKCSRLVTEPHRESELVKILN